MVDPTGGKALEAIEGLTSELRDLMHKLLGPAFEELGQLGGDKVRSWRWKNWARTLDKAQYIFAERGIEPGAVPPKLLLPIFEHASLEDDDDLVTKWAGLLATAAAGDLRRTAYPRILAELTSLDARILDYLYEDKIETGQYRWFHPEILLSTMEAPREDFYIAADNLFRLELCVPVTAGNSQPGAFKWVDLSLSYLGIDFVLACRGPQPEA